MSILDNNLKALVERLPKLVDRLRDDDGVVGVTIEETRSGDFTFQYEERYFLSKYDPVKEAKQQAKTLMDKKPDWIIIFGLGCGYLLRELTRARYDKVIVFEPSLEILKGVLGAVDLSFYLNMDNIYLTTDLDDLKKIIEDQVEGIDEIIGHHGQPYKESFPALVKDFIATIGKVHTRNQTSVSTEISSRLMWIENYFNNLESFIKYPFIGDLTNRFKGVPMILVGAGPSLAKNVEYLKEVKDKALIIAAITAYKPLVSHGVVPHFVIAAEKVDLPEYFTYGSEDKEVRLILAEVSNPSMFDRDVKGKFIMLSPYHSLSRIHEDIFPPHSYVTSGGSVTTSALDMGVAFGCKPIAMIGQDLSFSGGRTHSEGATYVDQDIVVDKELGEVRLVGNYDGTIDYKEVYQLHWIKGLDGEEVPTKFDWLTFHNWFEKYMEDHNRGRGDVKVFNSTEGGAYIEGMDHRPLKEVIEEYITEVHPIEDIISGAESGERGIDIDKLTSSFESMQRSVRSITKISKRIVKEAKRAEKIHDKMGLVIELKKHLDKITRAEEELFEEIGDVHFIWEALSEHTYKLKMFIKAQGKKDGDDDYKDDINIMISSYKFVDDTCSKILKILDEKVDYLKGLSINGSKGATAPTGVKV